MEDAWPAEIVIDWRFEEDAPLTVNVLYALDTREGKFPGTDAHDRAIALMKPMNGVGAIPCGILEEKPQPGSFGEYRTWEVTVGV